MRVIVFDTETTGLSPSEGDRIVEIGAVEVIDGIRTENAYHVYINPQRPVGRESQAIHGLSDLFLSDKPVFADIVAGFLDFIGDSRLAAHNASFDMKFINHELARAGYDRLGEDRFIDTMKIKGGGTTLDVLCRRYKIDASRRVKHGALLDAELLADVYYHLMGAGQKTLDIDTNINTAVNVRPPAYQRPEPLRRVIPGATVRAHRESLDSITDPLWKKFRLYPVERTKQT